MHLHQKQRRRSAQTLLELVAASTIIAMTLTPALRMMRDSLRVGRQTEMANLMATLAASQLEDALQDTAAVWSDTDTVGDFTALGYPTVKFSIVRTPELANTLMAITVTAWDDTNNNNNIDAGESRSVFASKLARNVAYQNEANGT